MQTLSFYGSTDTDLLPGESYDVAVASQTLNVPDCNPQIFYFTPSTINGGIAQQLEIHGLGFGNTRGTGRVRLKNANAGGLQEVILDADDYVGWSDNLIVVTVSGIDSGYTYSGSLSLSEVPGSGKVKVITNGGTTLVSNNDLTIHFSLRNDRVVSPSQKVPSYLAATGTNGGYQFLCDTAIYNHPDILGCVVKAMHDWTCATGVTWEITGSVVPPSDTAVIDGQNIIQFGNFANPAVVAEARSIMAACLPKFYSKEIDITVNKNISLYIDTNVTNVPAGQNDLYGALLHELGHAHLLNHVNDQYAIMYYATTSTGIPANQRKIFLGTDMTAQDGGNFVMNHSNVVNWSGCPVSDIIFTTPLVCNLLNEVDKISINPEISKAYPNPASDNIFIRLENSRSENSEIKVFDVTGQIVITTKFIHNSENEIQKLDIGELSPGIYIAEYYLGEKKCFFKFVKQ